MPTLIRVKRLDEICNEAVAACKAGAVQNLVITGVFERSEIVASWLDDYNELVKLWQNPCRPDSLPFNHGEFINRNGANGIEYLVEELRNRPDSNRACLSLLCMTDIVGRGDESFPSFLILQAGFTDPARTGLSLTAYFRALEVQSFLPVNVAEICSIARSLLDSSPDTKTVEITIIAFRAHVIPSFSCHNPAAIDLALAVDIVDAVRDNDTKEIAKWLQEKADKQETWVQTKGLELLLSAMTKHPDILPADVSEFVRDAIVNLKELAAIRRRSSHSGTINDAWKRAQENLLGAKESLLNRRT